MVECLLVCPGPWVPSTAGQNNNKLNNVWNIKTRVIAWDYPSTQRAEVGGQLCLQSEIMSQRQTQRLENGSVDTVPANIEPELMWGPQCWKKMNGKIYLLSLKGQDLSIPESW